MANNFDNEPQFDQPTNQKITQMQNSIANIPKVTEAINAKISELDPQIDATPWRTGYIDRLLDSLARINTSLAEAVDSIIAARYDNIGHTDAIDQGSFPIADDNSGSNLSSAPAKLQVHVAVIVGHDRVAQGAYSERLATSEYNFYNNIVTALPFYDSLDSKLASFSIHRREYARNSIARAYDEATSAIRASKLPGLTIELHFNGSRDTAINYSCALHWHGSATSRILATAFDEAISNRQPGVTPRGARAVNRNNAGGFNLSRSPYPGILIEPFFGSYRRLDQSYYETSFPSDLVDAIIETATHLPTTNLANPNQS